MELRKFIVDFCNIGKQSSLRIDYGYRYFFDIKKSKIWDKKHTLALKYLINTIKTKKIIKGILEDEEQLIEIGNIERRYNNLINIEKVDKIGSDKNILKRGDIIIPKLQPQMGNIFLNLTHKRYLASTELLEYKILAYNHPLFIYYLMTTQTFLSDLKSLESGKTHRRVNSEDLFKIKVPLISKSTQNQIVTQIELIEQKIKKLKAVIKEPQEIINEVFTREFNFNLEKFERLKKMKNYYLSLSYFSNNKDIRQSVKFHRQAGIFVLNEFKKITNMKIKNFLFEPIVLGATISPKDYDHYGDFFYISMANIKNWKFEEEGSKLVSMLYSSKNQNKTVNKGDIILARSGEGTIGKTALINDENLRGVFADFTMRIRLTNYNALFAYYYFRTYYFQFLIEIHKKGLGNNTNIFPSQIQEFPIINIPLSHQQKIVNEIKAKLDDQNQIKKTIEKERNKIDEIIEGVIKNA